MTDIVAYYDRLAAKYGPNPGAVDALSQAALDARWQALGDVTDLNGKRVLEVGCGYGGLGAYLTHRYPEIDYRGVDISLGLLALGKQAYPELSLFKADVLDLPPGNRYDVVLAQGIFYKLDVDAWQQTRRLIAKMYTLADEAAAFTALVLEERFERAESDDPDLNQQDPGLRVGHEYRLDPVRTLRYCRTLAPGVKYRNGYHPGDALFALYRKAL